MPGDDRVDLVDELFVLREVAEEGPEADGVVLREVGGGLDLLDVGGDAKNVLVCANEKGSTLLASGEIVAGHGSEVVLLRVDGKVGRVG